MCEEKKYREIGFRLGEIFHDALNREDLEEEEVEDYDEVTECEEVDQLGDAHKLREIL